MDLRDWRDGVEYPPCALLVDDRKVEFRPAGAGGLLVFAVCSLEREEGEEQVEAFLNAHPEFARAPLSADEIFGQGEWISPEGDLKTLPSHLSTQGGMDGFYAARLRRL